MMCAHINYSLVYVLASLYIHNYNHTYQPVKHKKRDNISKKSGFLSKKRDIS